MDYTELINELNRSTVGYAGLLGRATSAIEALQARCGKSFEEGRDFQAQVESQLRSERDAALARVTELESEANRLSEHATILRTRRDANRQLAEFNGEIAESLKDELEKALAKLEALEKQAPYCYHWEDRWGCNHYADPKESIGPNAVPLYASPVPAKTLTDEQIVEIGNAVDADRHVSDWYGMLNRFARAIEQALKGGA